MIGGTNPAGEQRHHLIVGGTGRAGTTFLVRYLTEIGLDTHLSRRGGHAPLDEHANAGLEDFPLGPDIESMPYVIKNPLIYQFLDDLISNERFKIDGVIIPMRSLRDAVSSRTILERRAIFENQPWLAYMDRAWDVAGSVPGGLVHSLDALDELRVLAVGFHLLVEKLVEADIPIVFIAFPRIVYDGPYLVNKLAAFHPKGIDEALALAAHARRG